MARELSTVFTHTYSSIPATGVVTDDVGGFRDETPVSFTITCESAGELFIEQSDNATPTETYHQIGRIATRASGVSTNSPAFHGGVGGIQLSTRATRRLKGKIRGRWMPLSAPSTGTFTLRIEIEYDVT